MIQDRIIKLERIPWRDIQDLQPQDLKQIFNYQHIENSIRAHGFAFPFGVWRDDDGTIYAIDGHTRKEVLHNMEDAPELLPAFFIDAVDRQEAIEILLEVYNQRTNPIDEQVMLSWLEAEEIAVESIAVQSLNVFGLGGGSGNASPDDYGDSFALPSGDKAPFQQMTFTFADEQAEQVKNAIADIKQTEEYKYCETMGNENGNGNALYLIVMQWAERRK